MLNDINDLIKIKENILLDLSDEIDENPKNAIIKMSLEELLQRVYSKETTVKKFIEKEIIKSYMLKNMSTNNLNYNTLIHIYRIYKKYYFIDPNITNWKNDKNLLYFSYYDTTYDIDEDLYEEVYNIHNSKDSNSRNTIIELSNKEINTEKEIFELENSNIE